jgi:hypothetical protein
MNRIILIHQRNKALQRVNEKYPEVFDKKPEIQAAVASFATNNERITELLAELAFPKPLVYTLKKDQARKLSIALSRKAGIGLLIASRQKDEPKATMYKTYKRVANLSNVWDLYQTSAQVATELAKETEIAADAGISAEELGAFQLQVEEFGHTIEATDSELKKRKAAIQERKTLMAENVVILRMQLEPYANLVQDTYPAFFRDFKIARRSPLPHKPSDKPVEVVAEISGMVTDTTNDQPVANATVMITELGIVTTTDGDGYYLLEDVPAGTFKISCHAPGYKLPDDAAVTIADAQSQQIDFSLEPEVAEQAV